MCPELRYEPGSKKTILGHTSKKKVCKYVRILLGTSYRVGCGPNYATSLRRVQHLEGDFFAFFIRVHTCMCRPTSYSTKFREWLIFNRFWSMALESMVMVLDCPCLASDAQLIQNLLNKPLTKFGILFTRTPASKPKALVDHVQICQFILNQVVLNVLMQRRQSFVK